MKTHGKGEARHGKEPDAFGVQRVAPLQQSLPYACEIHAPIMAQPGFPIHSRTCPLFGGKADVFDAPAGIGS